MTVSDDKAMYQTHYLPEPVTQVKKETIKSFSHSKRVGGYLLGRTLGVGSFAKVKEGLHLSTGERVAVKVIDKKRAKTDNYVRKNLRREGKLLQLVRHPNVVSLYEVMETDNSYYLVTQLCKGGDLMEYITARKRLPEAEVSKYIRQIISAVDYLHRLGIIHRDLKIENLLLDANKDIKLIDFGLSNFIKVANSPEGTRAQEFCVTQCGSPAYAAPELLNHEKYGLQVDLWSIGVNMYAMLTGGLPFTVEPFNIKALYAKMRDRQMNPLPDDLSRECKDLLRRFLNPDPARRITILEALSHPWIAQGNKPVTRHPCPNKMKTSDLDADILSHMSENLGFRMGEVIKFVTSNTPSPACAAYHLFLDRLTRHNAEQKSSGQTPAPSVTKPGKDEGRITLHLQDMRSKNNRDAQRQTSTAGVGTPTPRLQSRGMTSVATDGTDISKKDSGIGTEGSDNESIDRKENKHPLTRYDSVDLHIVDPNRSSPTPSDTSNGKGIFPFRHLTKRFPQDPQSKVSVYSSPRDKDQTLDVGRNLIEKLTAKAKTHPGKIEFGQLNDHQLTFAQESDSKNKRLASPPRITPRHKKEVSSTTTDTNKGKSHVDGQIDNRYKVHKTVNPQQQGQGHYSIDDNNNQNINIANRPHRYIKNNKLLSRRSTSKSNDVNVVNAANDKVYARLINGGTQPSKTSEHPHPTVCKIIPKQFVPFRSAQDRPRLSENYAPQPVPQKSKTSESLTLHSKNLLNSAYNENSNSPSQRPVSPPSKPVVVRRRLTKRYRMGEISPSGSHVIQDIDQSATTELLISDSLESRTVGDGIGMRSSPFPSLSPLHTTR